jgi:hypothetical protein
LPSCLKALVKVARISPIAGHQVATGSEVRVAAGKTRRHLAGDGDGNLRLLLAVPEVDRGGHLIEAEARGRLYRSRSAAMTAHGLTRFVSLGFGRLCRPDVVDMCGLICLGTSRDSAALVVDVTQPQTR